MMKQGRQVGGKDDLFEQAVHHELALTVIRVQVSEAGREGSGGGGTGRGSDRCLPVGRCV